MRRAILVALFLALACDGVGLEGRYVGGPCTTGSDCSPESRCLTGGDFPEGTCAPRCASHEDCPGGTRCVDKEDGVCLLECELPSECRGGYTCKGETNESGGGESLVCIEG